MRIAFAIAGIGLGAGISAQAQTQQTPQSQSIAPADRAGAGAPAVIDPMWKESFDAFAAADKATPPHLGGVLFVGSSSIRLWDDLEAQFKSEPYVIKRGFGGSSMADVARYVPQLVLPYKPSLVVVYAGDNDVAEGQTPQQVLKSFQRFVDQVHEALPETRIAYISIKPSPSREPLMAATWRTNQLIGQYTRTDKTLDYIDIYDQMLGADGRPRRDLFREDMLHLNPSGYAIWKAAITSHLRRSQSQALTQADVPSGTPAAPPTGTAQPAAAH